MSKKKGCVIILSGGKSERMKFPKPYLTIKGKTFVEKIIDEYRIAEVQEIILVMNKDFCDREWEDKLTKVLPVCKLVINSHPEEGRLYSLKLGIEKITIPGYCYIQQVDNPFVTKSVIDALWENRRLDGFVSPTFNGKGGHPVLLPEKIIKYIQLMLDAEVTLKEVLKKITRYEMLMSDDCILRNINTPEDYFQLANETVT